MGNRWTIYCADRGECFGSYRSRTFAEAVIVATQPMCELDHVAIPLHIIGPHVAPDEIAYTVPREIADANDFARDLIDLHKEHAHA